MAAPIPNAPPSYEAPPDKEDHSSRRFWIEVGVIFAFWTFLAVLMSVNRLMDPHGPPGRIGPVWDDVPRIFLDHYLWALLTPVIFWVSHRFSIEKSNWQRRVVLHLGIAILIAIVADIGFDLIKNYFFPLAVRKRPFDPLQEILRLWFLRELVVYFFVLATGFARDYFLRYQVRQKEAVWLRAQLAEARLETLRMQINPHFLFNTLHAVSTLVERDPKGVRRMIARLSALLRYTLEGNSAQEVPLRQELQFLDDYLEIQQIRFQGRLQVQQHIEPALLDALVPNLILQPLVENAIKHGAARVEGSGYIELRAWREGARLCLSVSDNGPGFLENTEGDGMPNLKKGLGLRNTQERLEGLYGSMQSLSLSAAEQGGVVAQITLPYHTGADLMTSAVS